MNKYSPRRSREEYSPIFTGLRRIIVAAAASEPEANEGGSYLISTHYWGLQSLFLTKRKGLWLCANGRFRMRSGMRERKHFRMRSDMTQGTVVMRQRMIQDAQ